MYKNLVAHSFTANNTNFSFKEIISLLILNIMIRPVIKTRIYYINFYTN